MLLPPDECSSIVKSYLRIVILLGLFLGICIHGNAQSITITSPATNPATYGVGTPIPVSANANPGIGFVTSVVYTLPPLSAVTGTGGSYTGSFNTSTLAIGNYTLTATMSYTFTVVPQTPISTSTAIVIVPAAPSATAPATCIGSPATISVSGGLPAGGTYNLYTASAGGTLLSSTSGSTIITPVVTANTTYYVSYKSGTFESFRTAVTITASTSPATPVFTATSTVATGANATITLTPVAGLTYSWDFSGGTPATGTGNGPFSVSWATAGAKLITVTATNAGGCTSTATQTVTVTKTVASGNYAFSQSITLNETGAGMVGAVSNFPVLVYIKEDALKSGVNCATNVKFPTGGTNGYDFAFTAVGGTNELFYQVESFDASTGTLLAWVQVPVLNTTTTNLTFYFGSLIPAHNTSFGNATWPTDYQAVYHFSEAAAAGSTTADATANLHTGTTSNLTAASNTTGIIGSNAYTFNGTNTRVAANAVNISSSFTLSAWIKLNATGIDQKIMTNQIATGSASGGYKLGVYTDNTIEAESPQINRTSTPAAPAFTTTGWHYVQGVFNTTDNTLRTYTDGIANKVLTTNTSPSSLNPLYIGVGEGGFNWWFNGIIDEARISNTAKTGDWIKAEYFNQLNYLTFTTSTGTIVGNVANAAAIGGSIVYTWTGTTSTDVNVAGNWRTPASGNPVASAAPPSDGTASLNIPSVTNKPILTANGAYYGVTIASGSSLNLGTFTLTVGCNVYNSGTMNTAAVANTSTIAWNGTFTPQLYTGTNTAGTAQFGSFIVNNTASSGIVRITGGPLDVYNTLTLTAGGLAIDNAGNGALTLKSTATLTASVPTYAGSGTVTGNVFAERYIPGGANRRGYRLLSAPVSSQSPGAIDSYDFIEPIKTTLVSGPGNSSFTTGAVNNNGFDASPNNNSAPLVYKESDIDPTTRNVIGSDYKGWASINEYIPMGNGVLFFFRGDRVLTQAGNTSGNSFIPPYPNPNNTTIRFTGKIVTGDVLVQRPVFTSAATYYNIKNTAVAPSNIQTVTSFSSALSFTNNPGNKNGFNLVGNPYPSTIDLEKIVLTNMAGTRPTIYTLNNVNGLGFGTYQLSGTGSGASNIDGSALNGGSRYALSGEGFFVKATNSSATVTFKEAAKVAYPAVANIPTVFSIALKNPSLRIKLVQDSILYNETLINFKEASSNNLNENEDVVYLTAPSQLIFMYSNTADGSPCVINNMGSLRTIKSVSLYAEASSTGIYQIQFTGAETIDSHYRIFLKDAFTKDSLEITAHPTYNFNINRADPTTYGANRFSLVVHTDVTGPYKFVRLTGNKTPNSIQLDWETQNESDVVTFSVQKSTDGGNSFVTLATIQSANKGGYTYNDDNADLGIDNIYRIKQADVADVVTYSDLLTITKPSAIAKPAITGGIMVYPNPASESINVIITKSVIAPVELHIVNANGKIIRKGNFSAAQQFQQNVTGLQPGVYIIDVFETTTNKKLATTKFIKN
ncbi:Ig-like domain-containing protein [Mucilaginibacter glaciei]|uniref:T9SS type A sorting domain-containing protein n=1 Tax=Mucilaginibacter glaciei TaxID=2772109 RepID=A0A926NSC3_9SPHI|nr:LamG-like jellyroll fold domain-containing protein [Mucilaginibacter glaciei]MBD1393060.1 T9SS type A sorting domain-containing protein [Mucilaginibacter glaciei]